MCRVMLYTRKVLHEFLTANHREILARSRLKLATRQVPMPTDAELADGLPIFLDQLVGILRSKKDLRDRGHEEISERAALHGGELLRMGLTVGQVVHDYGSICQSVTELADERGLAITADEFQTFNRCLDDAIAAAVTAYGIERERDLASEDTARLGVFGHELRHLLASAIIGFDVVKRGKIGRAHV